MQIGVTCAPAVRDDAGGCFPAYTVIDRAAAAACFPSVTDGPGQFALDLESITVDGRRYAMDTAGPEYNMPPAEHNGGGGLVGAIVGAIAGADGEQVTTQGG